MNALVLFPNVVNQVIKGKQVFQVMIVETLTRKWR